MVDQQNNVRNDDDLLSANDLREQYKLSRDFARHLIYGGVIPSIAIGARQRVTTRGAFRRWQRESLSTPDWDGNRPIPPTS